MGFQGGIVGDFVAVGIVLRQILEGIGPEISRDLGVFAAPQVLHITVLLNPGNRISILIQLQGIVLVVFVYRLEQRHVHIRPLILLNPVLIQPQQIEGHIPGILEGIDNSLTAFQTAAAIAGIGYSGTGMDVAALRPLLPIRFPLHGFGNGIMQELSVLIIEGQVIVDKGLIALILGNIHILRQSDLGCPGGIAVNRLPAAGIDRGMNPGVAKAVLTVFQLRIRLGIIGAVHSDRGCKQAAVNRAVVLPDLSDTQLDSAKAQVGNGIEFLSVDRGSLIRVQMVLIRAVVIDHRILGAAIPNGPVSGGSVGGVPNRGSQFALAHLDLRHPESAPVQAPAGILLQLGILCPGNPPAAVCVNGNIHCLHPVEGIIHTDRATQDASGSVEQRAILRAHIKEHRSPVGGGAVIQPDLAHIDGSPAFSHDIVNMDGIWLPDSILIRVLIVGRQRRRAGYRVFLGNVIVAVSVFVILRKLREGGNPVGNQSAVIAWILCLQGEHSGLTVKLVWAHGAALVHLVEGEADIGLYRFLIPALFDPVQGGALQLVGKHRAAGSAIHHGGHRKTLLNVPDRAGGIHGFPVHRENIGYCFSLTGVRRSFCILGKRDRLRGSTHGNRLPILRHTGLFPPEDQLTALAIVSVHGHRGCVGEG